ncbi:MAG: HIT domain-containing protein [Actinomycetaceae bacterium]|nr:HIT domain-containing protein [Actinomycetaceae bacterium]
MTSRDFVEDAAPNLCHAAAGATDLTALRPTHDNPDNVRQPRCSGHDGVPVEDSADFAGKPDGFQRLWTPHRMVYIDGESRPQSGDSHECPFCLAPKKPDEESLIVYRGDNVFALMNLFPYNSGHLLICPYEHISNYSELDPQVRDEFGEVTTTAIHALKAASAPQGFNIGMNQGEVAGAGIAAHLHQHIVPRWFGDANFFPLIARTKAIPELLSDARTKIVEAWPKA